MTRPAVDSIGTAAFQFTFGGSVTISHTVGGTNRLLIVVAEATSSTVSGVTYGGVAMTLKSTMTNGSVNAYLFYLLAPALGTANVVVSMSGFGSLGAQSISWTGVDQAAILGTAATGSGSSTFDAAVDSTADDMIVDVLGEDSSVGSPSAHTGQTVIANGSAPSNTSRLGSSYKNGAAVSTNMGWDLAITYAWIGVAVKGIVVVIPDPEENFTLNAFVNTARAANASCLTAKTFSRVGIL